MDSQNAASEVDLILVVLDKGLLVLEGQVHKLYLVYL